MTSDILPMGPVAQPVVKLTDAVRVFPGVVALRGVSLSLTAGEYVSIMGPSGSGKSTLLNILGLLDRPTSGEYELAGIDTSLMKDKDRSLLRGVTLGFVFQAFHLLGRLTTIDNVMLGMAYSGTSRSVRLARAKDALARVGMSARANAFPRVLSGGERQRVAIARAVAARPQVLLADEPTGNLDKANSDSVLELLDELHYDGLTVVVVTHDPEVAERAARQIVVHDGQIESDT